MNLSLYWWRRRWLLRTLILTSGTAEWWRPAEQSMFCPDRKPDWRHLYHYTIINVLCIFLFFKINYRKFKQQEYHSANIHGENIFLFNCFLNSRIPPQSLKLTKSSMLYNWQFPPSSCFSWKKEKNIQEMRADTTRSVRCIYVGHSAKKFLFFYLFYLESKMSITTISKNKQWIEYDGHFNK